MFILKKGHQPGVYVPLRALFLVLLTPNATARKRNELTRGTSLDRVDSELVKRLIDCAGK